MSKEKSSSILWVLCGIYTKGGCIIVLCSFKKIQRVLMYQDWLHEIVMSQIQRGEGIQEQVSRSSSHLCWISEVCGLRHVKLELELRKINLLGLSGRWGFICSRITFELQVSKTYIQLRLVKSFTRNCCDEYAIRPIP